MGHSNQQVSLSDGRAAAVCVPAWRQQHCCRHSTPSPDSLLPVCILAPAYFQERASDGAGPHS